MISVVIVINSVVHQKGFIIVQSNVYLLKWVTFWSKSNTFDYSVHCSPEHNAEITGLPVSPALSRRVWSVLVTERSSLWAVWKSKPARQSAKLEVCKERNANERRSQFEFRVCNEWTRWPARAFCSSSIFKFERFDSKFKNILRFFSTKNKMAGYGRLRNG